MIVAGFGFRQSATRESLVDALRRAWVAPGPASLATATVKAAHPALAALAADLGIGVEAMPADALASQTTLTHSPRSWAAHGTGSVAEAAALAALGPGARLLGPRSVSGDGRATCALAWKDIT
ncbi:precorrin methylase [Roseivivax halodurans JCM 10272]|uniref:Precorrin methylase n=1 Tax=Roseivivax halodurans JCM 10272 TaxID=1449350 RepID=X7EEN2_9RHOB|nr:cobalamin biosynthesis protein [Roseivivax halodurans]ETX13676.1 precorrin methylase [Roseivivax halodurans JCM 10272]